MSSNSPKSSKDPKGSNSQTAWVTILLAVIGLFGTLGAAYLSRPPADTSSTKKTTEPDTVSPGREAVPVPEITEPEVRPPNSTSPDKEDPVADEPEVDPEPQVPEIPEYRKLAITGVTAHDDNYFAGIYNPGRMIDGSCDHDTYWSSTDDLNVVLDFELEPESTVSEIGFLSTRISGPRGNSSIGTQPRMIKLTFFGANKEPITEREIEPYTPIIQPIFTKFEPVEGVSRIQMQPLEPIDETDGQRFTFNEVEFHGYTSNVSEPSGSTSGCLDRTAVSLKPS